MSRDGIVESGLRFGPYPRGRLFRIETSALHHAAGEGVKIAEFVLHRPGKGKKPARIWVVEAKTSAPRPESTESFEAYLAAIRDKFRNTLDLTVAGALGRHGRAGKGLPARFRSRAAARAPVCFCLVVSGHQEAWLPPLKEALEKSLRVLARCWAFAAPFAVVLNDRLAIEHGIASGRAA